MHIITQKRIWEAKTKYPNSANAIDGWFRILKKNTFKNFSELKRTFNTIDKAGNFYIFDIGGNKLRILVNINFEYQKVFIRHILTHSEYDRVKL